MVQSDPASPRSRDDDSARASVAEMSEQAKDAARVHAGVAEISAVPTVELPRPAFERFPTPVAGIKAKPWPNLKDQGRFEVTKQEGDGMMFKVPTLRNIAETAPHFHDGSAPTLALAVQPDLPPSSAETPGPLP